MIRAFALVSDDHGAAPRSLIAYFTVVTAAASTEPEDEYERLVAGMYQREHVASYQRVGIPVELVFHHREPKVSCRKPISMPGGWYYQNSAGAWRKLPRSYTEDIGPPGQVKM
jgi:hypothetical protein